MCVCVFVSLDLHLAEMWMHYAFHVHLSLQVERNRNEIKSNKQKKRRIRKEISHISATMTTVWIRQIELGHGHTHANCLHFLFSASHLFIRILFGRVYVFLILLYQK